jgi:predicted DNA-binding protein YlxM (UPF0122 family)
MREVFPIWCELYKAGFSLREIAEAYAVSRTVVTNFLKSCGIKMRTGSQAALNARLTGRQKNNWWVERSSETFSAGSL